MALLSWRALLLALAVAALLLLLVPPSAGDEREPPAPRTLMAAGSTDVADVLYRAGTLMDRSFVWDAANPMIRGRRLEATHPIRMPSEGAMDLLKRLLSMHSLKAHAAWESSSAPLLVRRTSDPPRRVQEVYILEHTLAETVALLVHRHLRPDAGDRMQVTADPRANKLFLSGTEDEVADAKEMIEHLDVPIYAVRSEVHVIFLKHRDCRELVALLRKLAAGSSVFGWPRGLPRPPPHPTQRQAPFWELDESPVILCDVRSNSLVVAGTRWQWDQVSYLVEALDLPPETWGADRAEKEDR